MKLILFDGETTFETEIPFDIKFDDSEKILPRPVIRDGNGKLVKDYTPRDWYLKLQEEIFEVTDRLKVFYEVSDYYKKRLAEEVADVITVCISMLEANGIDENQRNEIFAKVNKKSEKRGYFEETD